MYRFMDIDLYSFVCEHKACENRKYPLHRLTQTTLLYFWRVVWLSAVLVSPWTDGGGEQEQREEEESKRGGVKGGYIPRRDKADASRRPSGKHQTLLLLTPQLTHQTSKQPPTKYTLDQIVTFLIL